MGCCENYKVTSNSMKLVEFGGGGVATCSVELITHFLFVIVSLNLTGFNSDIEKKYFFSYHHGEYKRDYHSGDKCYLNFENVWF